ncbi:MAG: hypothetical protein AAFR61_16605 [Bacteroidota bacterium]
MIRIFFILIGFSLWLPMPHALGQTALDCSCQSDEPLPSQGKEPNIIFKGKVLDVTTNWISGGMKYSFAVEEQWGKSTDRFLILTSPFAQKCGFPFEEGETYLVYAYKGFSIKTDICSATKPWAEAAEEVALLGPSTQPKPGSMVNIMYWTIGLIGFLSIGLLGAFLLFKKRQGKQV